MVSSLALRSQMPALCFHTPSPPPPAHPTGAIWPPPTQPGHAKTHFCFFKEYYSLQAERTFWLKHVSGAMDPTCCPNFLARILNGFPSFPPTFLSPVPRVLFNLLPSIPGLSLAALLTLGYSHSIFTCSPGREFS